MTEDKRKRRGVTAETRPDGSFNFNLNTSYTRHGQQSFVSANALAGYASAPPFTYISVKRIMVKDRPPLPEGGIR